MKYQGLGGLYICLHPCSLYQINWCLQNTPCAIHLRRQSRIDLPSYMHVLWEDNNCLPQPYIKWLCSGTGRRRHYPNLYIKAQQISPSALGFPVKVAANWQLLCVRSQVHCPDTEPKSRQAVLWVRRMSWFADSTRFLSRYYRYQSPILLLC